MLCMLLTTITIILLVAAQSMFGSTTTHALPWAFVSTLMLLNIVEKQ